MIKFLNKLLNIRSREWPRLLLFFIILAIPNMGIVWGSTVAYTAFLKEVGIEGLPWVLVGGSALSIVAIAIYAAFVDRVADDILLIAIFALGGVGIVIGLLLLLAGFSTIAYPLLYLLFLAWAAVASPHLYTYINAYYDAQAVKRIFPLLLAAGAGGVILAGFSLSWIIFLSPTTIILIWLASYLVAILTIWFIPNLLRAPRRPPTSTTSPSTSQSEDSKDSFMRNLREGVQFTKQSSYLQWITITTLLTTALMAFLEYRASQILAEQFTQEQFASLVGVLDGISNIIALPLLLFGVSRLIGWLGVANVSFLFPAATLLVSSSLVYFPGLGTAVSSYLNRKGLRGGIQDPIDILLFSAVPLRVRGRARAFVGGLITPIGSLVGGLLLLPPIGNNATLLSALIALLAITYTISAWIMKQKYSQALVQMLEQEDYSFLLSQSSADLPAADPATLNRLRSKLEASNSHELRVFMTKLITQIAGRQSLSIIAPAIQNTAEANTRAAMVNVLSASDLRGNELASLYRSLLQDHDPRVRQAAVIGLEQVSDPSSQAFIAEMLPVVEDLEPEVSAQALMAVSRSGKFYQVAPAVKALEDLLNSKSAQKRVHGVRILGKIDDPRAFHQLLEYLADPSDAVRLETVSATDEFLETLLPGLGAGNPLLIDKIIERVSPLTQDRVERVREYAITILGRLSSPTANQAILQSMHDPSPQVRATIANTLANAGKSITPMIQPLLASEDIQIRKMAMVILGRINPREFGALITDNAIENNLNTIYQAYLLAQALEPLSQFRSIKVLQSALSESGQSLSTEILYFLTALHSPESVKIVGESLRSDDVHVRANAVEALESMTTPHLARLSAPLYEPHLVLSDLVENAKTGWNLDQPDARTALENLAKATDNPWLRALTIFTFGELGAALKEAQASDKTSAPPLGAEPSSDEKPVTSRRRIPRGGLDLFGALDDSASASTSPVQPVDSPIEKAQPKKQSLDIPFTLNEIIAILENALGDGETQVKEAALAAQRRLTFSQSTITHQEEIMLSIIDRIIFLKEVPFFTDMTVDQLKVLASVCEERLFTKDTRIVSSGDMGGELYVVVNGRVGIEQEKRAGSFARLATAEAYAYFGETNFFDGSPHTTTAVALQDTLTLQLRREPLIALARQNPEMSLKLINVLSQRLRESNDRIAELTRSMPRELHRLFDQFD
jgi:HEAT repeat protein